MKSADLVKLLTKNGWTLLRVKGSHHQFVHPNMPGKVVTVPHPKKELGKGLVHVILKESGLR